MKAKKPHIIEIKRDSKGYYMVIKSEKINEKFVKKIKDVVESWLVDKLADKIKKSNVYKIGK